MTVADHLSKPDFFIPLPTSPLPWKLQESKSFMPFSFMNVPGHCIGWWSTADLSHLEGFQPSTVCPQGTTCKLMNLDVEATLQCFTSWHLASMSTLLPSVEMYSQLSGQLLHSLVPLLGLSFQGRSSPHKGFAVILQVLAGGLPGSVSGPRSFPCLNGKGRPHRSSTSAAFDYVCQASTCHLSPTEACFWDYCLFNFWQ